jgi:hypothetical protein
MENTYKTISFRFIRDLSVSCLRKGVYILCGNFRSVELDGAELSTGESKMTELDDAAERIADGEDDVARLEQALVEAYYLGLSLRALAANPDFRFAEVTAAAGEPLIGWAKFVDERLQAGEKPFVVHRAAGNGAFPPKSRRR